MGWATEYLKLAAKEDEREDQTGKIVGGLALGGLAGAGAYGAHRLKQRLDSLAPSAGLEPALSDFNAAATSRDPVTSVLGYTDAGSRLMHESAPGLGTGRDLMEKVHGNPLIAKVIGSKGFTPDMREHYDAFKAGPTPALLQLGREANTADPTSIHRLQQAQYEGLQSYLGDVDSTGVGPSVRDWIKTPEGAFAFSSSPAHTDMAKAVSSRYQQLTGRSADAVTEQLRHSPTYSEALRQMAGSGGSGAHDALVAGLHGGPEAQLAKLRSDPAFMGKLRFNDFEAGTDVAGAVEKGDWASVPHATQVDINRKILEANPVMAQTIGEQTARTSGEYTNLTRPVEWLAAARRRLSGMSGGARLGLGAAALGGLGLAGYGAYRALRSKPQDEEKTSAAADDEEKDEKSPSVARRLGAIGAGVGTMVGAGLGGSAVGIALPHVLGQRPLSPTDAARTGMYVRPETSSDLPPNVLSRMQRYLGDGAGRTPLRQYPDREWSIGPLSDQRGLDVTQSTASPFPKVLKPELLSHYDPAGSTVRSDASSPDVIAHELGHASTGWRAPGGFIGYQLSDLGNVLPFAGAIDPKRARAYGYIGSAMHLPKLYEEGRATVRGLAALNAATAKLPTSQRLSIMGRAGARLGLAGLTYGIGAATPAITGLVMDRVLNGPRRDAEDEEKTSGVLRNIGGHAAGIGKGIAGVAGLGYGVGKAGLGAGLFAMKHPVLVGGTLGAGALLGGGYLASKAIKAARRPSAADPQTSTAQPRPRLPGL